MCTNWLIKLSSVIKNNGPILFLLLWPEDIIKISGYFYPRLIHQNYKNTPSIHTSDFCKLVTFNPTANILCFSLSWPMNFRKMLLELIIPKCYNNGKSCTAISDASENEPRNLRPPHFGTNVAENEKGENSFNQKVFSFSILTEIFHHRLWFPYNSLLLYNKFSMV